MDKLKVCRISVSPMPFQAIFRGQIRYLRENGFDVSIICGQGPGVESVMESENCPLYEVPLSRTISPWADLQSVWHIYRVLRRIQPDIVHTHTSKAGLVGLIAAVFARIPVRIHSVPGLRLREAAGLEYWILFLSELLIGRLSTQVFPNSLSLKKYLLKNKLCSPDKVDMFGAGSSNGVDIERFHPNLKKSGQCRKRYRIPEDAVVLGFVGRIVGDKGIRELISVFLSLRSQFSKLHLVFIGDFESNLDPIDSSVRDHITGHPEIHVTGWVEHVEEYLCSVDILIHPSYREGFANALLQAGALEIPAIAFDVEGCNDVIVDGETGVLVPPRNVDLLEKAALKLIKDPQLGNKMGKNARKYICETFSSKRIWRSVHDVYNSV